MADQGQLRAGEIDQVTFDHNADARRVTPVGWDGTDYVKVLHAIDGTTIVQGTVTPGKSEVKTSIDNSSTIELDGSATFTGVYEDVKGYGSIVVMCFADQTGSFVVNWSSDGTNTDFTETTETMAASVGRAFKYDFKAAYVQVVYTNDGTDQTVFRLTTYYLPAGSDQGAWSTGSSSDPYYLEDTAHTSGDQGTFVLAVRNDAGTALAADGDYISLNTDSAGRLRTTAPGGGGGGCCHADDAAFSIGSADSITPIGMLADDTASDSVDEGDVGLARMTLTRKPYAVITDPTSENNAAVDASGYLQVVQATQYTEDSVHSSTDPGQFVLGVRNDTIASLAGNLDYHPITVGSGGGMHLSATFIEDTTGTSDNYGVRIFALRRDADTSIVGTDGDYSSLQVDALGRLKVEVFDGGDSHTVDGTVTANAGTGDFNVSLQDGAGTDLTSTLVGADQSLDVNLTQSVALDVSAATVTVDTEMAAAAALSDSFANPTTAPVGAFLMGWDGANWERVETNGNGDLHIDHENYNFEAQFVSTGSIAGTGVGNDQYPSGLWTNNRLWGLDVESDQDIHPIKCSEQGALIVAASAGTNTTSSHTQPTVTDASANITGADSDRYYMLIENFGGNTIWINLGGTAVKDQGIEIPNGATYEFTAFGNPWTGSVAAICDTGLSSTLLVTRITN